MLTDHTPALAPDVEVRIHGNLTEHNLPALADELCASMRLRPQNLILDVRHCTDMNPDAIRLVLATEAEARLIGSHLVLHHPTPTLTRSLAMAGALRWLTIAYPTSGAQRGSTADPSEPQPISTPLQRLAALRFARW